MNKLVGVIMVMMDFVVKMVMDLFNMMDFCDDLFFVGCFDKDIEGILVIMNDGVLLYDLLLLNYYVMKVYEVEVMGEIIVV